MYVEAALWYFKVKFSQTANSVQSLYKGINGPKVY